MNFYWPMRLSLLLYLALLALISVNLAQLFRLPLIVVGIAPGIAAIALLGAWLFGGARRTLLTCLLTIGTLGLTAVAVVLALPAWRVIAGEPSGASAGQMAPVFAAALALHACNLWVAAVNSGEQEQSTERLARLLYGPGALASLITALILCAGATLGLEWLSTRGEQYDEWTRRFLQRGIIPPLTVTLFFWGALLLFGKAWNNSYLRRTIKHWPNAAPPSLAAFAVGLDVLSVNAAAIDRGMHLLWQRHEESYLLPRYLSWAVPILGFIGTVLGISLAAEGIRRIIGSDAGLASLSGDLDGAIAPLGIAFDTTLVALSLSVVLMLLLVLTQRSEQRLLANLERRLRETAGG